MCILPPCNSCVVAMYVNITVIDKHLIICISELKVRKDLVYYERGKHKHAFYVFRAAIE